MGFCHDINPSTPPYFFLVNRKKVIQLITGIKSIWCKQFWWRVLVKAETKRIHSQTCKKVIEVLNFFFFFVINRDTQIIWMRICKSNTMLWANTRKPGKRACLRSLSSVQGRRVSEICQNIRTHCVIVYLHNINIGFSMFYCCHNWLRISLDVGLDRISYEMTFDFGSNLVFFCYPTLTAPFFFNPLLCKGWIFFFFEVWEVT